MVTVAGGRSNVQVARSNGSRQLRVWGTIPAGAAPEGRSLAVDDPAQFAAATLWDALIRRGVQVIGRPVARHRLTGRIGPAQKRRAIFRHRVGAPPLAAARGYSDSRQQGEPEPARGVAARGGGTRPRQGGKPRGGTGAIGPVPGRSRRAARRGSTGRRLRPVGAGHGHAAGYDPAARLHGSLSAPGCLDQLPGGGGRRGNLEPALSRETPRQSAFAPRRERSATSAPSAAMRSRRAGTRSRSPSW